MIAFPKSARNGPLGGAAARVSVGGVIKNFGGSQMFDYKTDDPIVNAVIRKYSLRSAMGMKLYGQSMAANDKPIAKWLVDLQEELMDASLYLQKILETEDCSECGERYIECLCVECPECSKQILECICVEV